MGIAKDKEKANKFVKRAIMHGDSIVKLRALRDLVSITEDKDSSFVYLNQMIDLDSTHTWALDALGHRYEFSGDIEKAVTFYLKSGNINKRTQVALWYIEGTGVKKDLDRGIKILKDAAGRMEAKKSFQGNINPKDELNRLHYCEKQITKDQLGKYDQGYFICSPGG